MGIFGNKKETKKSKKKSSIKEDINIKGGIRFSAIIELLGAPKKHIEETIKAFVDKIKKNPDYKIIKADISSAKKVEKEEAQKLDKTKQELYSIFVELEVATTKKEKLFDFCFNYMPSSIEVMEPMSIGFSANELSAFLTDIQGTLHKIDFALKNVNAANKVLNNNMLQMLQNNIVLSLKTGDKDLPGLSKNVGIPDDQLKPFIEKMVEAGLVKLNKKKYVLVKKK